MGRSAAGGIVAIALLYACGSDDDPPPSGGMAGKAGAAGSTNAAAAAGNAGAEGGRGGSGGDAGRTASGGSAGEEELPGAGSAGEAEMGSAGSDAGGAGVASGGRTGGSSAGGNAGEAGAEAGAAGTASEPVNLPRFASGSRLRARVYVGSDGSRHAFGFHDTLLDLDCEFANLGAAGYRCAPLAASAYDDAFADDECGVRVVGFEAACEAPRYHLDFSTSDVCDGLARANVVVVGEPVESVFRASGEACEPESDADPSIQWRRVTPADPTDFVEGSLEQLELGGGLRVQVVNAEDGARAALSFYFAEQPCQAQEITGAGLRCAPAPPMNLLPLFADDQCTAGLAFAFSSAACAAPPHRLVRRSEQSGECPPRVTELVAVSRFSGTTAYEGEACVSTSVFPSMNRWVIGDPVDPTPLPELASERLGTNRLQPLALRTEGGSSIELGTGTYDTELETECGPYSFEDGVLRCVPPTQAADTYYSDSDCSVPIGVANECAPAVYYGTFRGGGSACSSPLIMKGLYRPGPVHTGPIYWWAEESVCGEVTDLSEPFVTLVPVDSAELVTLSAEVE